MGDPVVIVGMLIQVLVPVAVITGGLWVVSKTPIGRSLIDRVRGDAPSNRELADEVVRLQEEITLMHERLDFTDRLLARSQELERREPESDAP